MRTGIRVPFVDTCAADLTWTLDHPLITPLATRVVRVGTSVIEFRVLGASHQVRAADGVGADRLLETVACLPGQEGTLPSRTTDRVADTTGYRFTSTVETLAPDELHTRVKRLTADIDGRPDGLLATFPSDPLAVTAMAIHTPPGDPVIGWRTWHAYPQSGELVTTTTSVAVRHPHSAT